MSKLLEEFKSLKNDNERWEWVIKNKDNGITVHCDNDQTFITDNDDEDDYADFDEFIGWSDGIFYLLDAVGIPAESV